MEDLMKQNIAVFNAITNIVLSKDFKLDQSELMDHVYKIFD